MPIRASSLNQNTSTGIDRDIGSQYDNVKIVAENIEAVKTDAEHIDQIAVVADNIQEVSNLSSRIGEVITIGANIAEIATVAANIDNVDIVASNIGKLDTVIAEVIPNLDEILLADDNATIATTKATEASTSAANALVSEQNAKASELVAVASEAVAVAKAGEADASATAAHNSELAAAAMLDAFDDRYLGSYIEDPVLDNDGQPLTDGALYFNTSINALKVYDVGTAMWLTIPQIRLSGLLDVQLTSITTGDVLKWDGTKWINTNEFSNHVVDTNNPHYVTKSQVGLDNVDNTADIDKNVLSATKWTTARTISSTGDVDWSVSADGSADVTGVATLTNSGVIAGVYKSVSVDSKGRVTNGTNPTTISGFGITDAYTKTEVQTVLPKVGLDVTNTTTPSDTGQMAWNQTEQTLDINLGNGVVLQTGQEFLIPVRNNTVSTITNMTVCMATGSIGNSGRITVAPMDGTTQSNADKIIGVATQDIAPGADGFVTITGKIRGVDTSGLVEGNPIYVSTSVIGGLTTTVPTTGMKLKIGYVVHSHTNGTVFIRITILDENAYVQKVTSTDNAIVRYDGTTGNVQNSLVTIDDTGLINGQVVNVPSGNISATTVQTAINQLDTAVTNAIGNALAFAIALG